MNRLPKEKQVQILSLLVEGMSMRSISRVCDVSINTISKLLVNAGEACGEYHDKHVTDVKVNRLECDEIWAFVYAKKKNVPRAKAAPEGAGDAWTWVALDPESKLMVSYLTGQRNTRYALEFMADAQGRLRGGDRIQLTTDGLKAYLEAVEAAFGGNVDYAQLVKMYGNPDLPAESANATETHYSPPACVGVRKKVIEGNPDPQYICTSFIERGNLTLRMGMRRFTRLTNGHSKKLVNHLRMLDLFFLHYNFCRRHSTIRVSPAMEAGLSDTLHDIDWIVDLIEARRPPPRKRGPYRKRRTPP